MIVKRLVYLSLCLSLSAFSGCRSPLASEKKAAAAVTAVKVAIDAKADAITDKAKGQVFATGLAMERETNESPALLLAKSFNLRAGLTLGPPDYQSAVDYAAIVSGALSTNATLQAEALKKLSAKDAEIIGLQAKLTLLQGKLAKTEARRDEDYAKAAAEAETWSRLKWWAWFTAFGFVGLSCLPIGLKVASLAFPILAPVAGIFENLLGSCVKAVFRVVPAATASAGVVGAAAYEKVDTALNHVVLAVQRTKASPAPSIEELRGQLKHATDTQSRAVIAEKKAELNLI